MWNRNLINVTSRALLFAHFVFASSMALAIDSPWSKVKEVVSGPAEVVGGVAGGCLGGAEALPPEGPGFVSIRRERNRYYAHPDTVTLVKDTGLAVAANGKQLMMVGDLSQPRGGLMDSKHRSHQNGLDADIWFTPTDSVKAALESTPEGSDPPSMLSEDKRSVNALWGKHQLFLIKTVAMNPKVERIFANPGIKKYLCDTVKGDRGWLHKVRPWWGHDAHFHVRLYCPQGSPDCKQQNALPEGDGCDGLAYWFRPLPKVVKSVLDEKKEPPKKVFPPAMSPKCRTILTGTWPNKLASQEQGGFVDQN